MKRFLFLLSFCILILGCNNQSEKTTKAKFVVTSGLGDGLIYEFEDRGCLFLASYKGGLIHHPACKNLNHNQ